MTSRAFVESCDGSTRKFNGIQCFALTVDRMKPRIGDKDLESQPTEVEPCDLQSLTSIFLVLVASYCTTRPSCAMMTSKPLCLPLLFLASIATVISGDIHPHSF